MKKLLTLLFLSFGLVTFGQVYQLMPQYGYQASRFRFDSTLQIPTVCGVPTLKSNVTRLGAIAFDSCNNRFYTYNPKTATWSQVSGGGGSTDTTSLSNRINLKLDSVKRRSDSVFAYRNGTEVFQFRDSIRPIDTPTTIVMNVVNATGTTLTKGTVVYLFGATGNTASVKRANNKNDSTSSKTIGVVRRDIAAGATGTVTTQGQVEKLNLGAYAEGDILWLDSIDGGLTKNKPQAPFHAVFVGVVERANSGNGVMYIKPQNGVELDEIHDVQIGALANNQMLVYSDTQRVWKNRMVGLQQILNNSSVLNVNDTIKTNGKVLQLNATASTRNTTFKIDSNRILFNSVSGANNSGFDFLSNSIILSQISGSNSNTLNIGPFIGVDLSSADAFTTDGFNTSASVGSFWYVDAYDTIGILPRTDGTSGQILKLGDGAQLVWANDETGSVDTTSLSNRINQRVRYTDTASMLTPYLRKTDTASLSNRINTKLNISDTSVFQRKELPAYSFMANGTSAAANSVATYFKDTSGTYTGTITWGSSNPSGTTNHTYKWTRIGKMVNLTVSLVYGTASAANNTTLTFTLPSDAPTPSEPAGLTAASTYMYPAYCIGGNTLTSVANLGFRGGMRNNSGNNGYEVVIAFNASTFIYFVTTITYWTD